MSTESPQRPVTSQHKESPWANGLSIFAGSLMVIAGVWHMLAGIAALANDNVYVTTPQYIYAFDLTGWGWIHLLLGAVVVAGGVGVLTGKTWGRVLGIVVASLSLIANFLFIPWYPIWSLLIVALDVAIIWALAVYRREGLY
jgi:hypothetical protein